MPTKKTAARDGDGYWGPSRGLLTNTDAAPIPDHFHFLRNLDVCVPYVGRRRDGLPLIVPPETGGPLKVP